MFSYQGSCRSFLTTALIFYQIRFALSRTFLFFFSVRPLSSRSAPSDSLYRLSHQRHLVNNFFHLFSQHSQSLFFRFLPSGRSASASPAGALIPAALSSCPQRQVLSYHLCQELSMFFLFLFISDNSHNSDFIFMSDKLYNLIRSLPSVLLAVIYKGTNNDARYRKRNTRPVTLTAADPHGISFAAKTAIGSTVIDTRSQIRRYFTMYGQLLLLKLTPGIFKRNTHHCKH